MRLAIFIVLSSLIGCTSPIELDFPGSYSPKIVVNSVFTPDSIWTVYLHQSTPYADSTNWEDLHVLDAIVSITDGRGMTERLRHVEGGMYKSFQGLRPVPDTEYTLRVDVPSLVPVQAKSSAPELIVSLDSIKELQEPERSRKGLYEVTLSLKDPAGSHRYSIETLQVWPECKEWRRLDGLPPLENAGNGFTSIPLKSSFPGLHSSPSEVEDASEETIAIDEHIVSVYFSDKLFEQEIANITLTLEIEHYEEVAPYFMIVVSSWSRELWDHDISYRRSTGFDYEDFLTNPRPVPAGTNVENGLGYFAGITRKRFRRDREGREWTDEQVNLVENCDAPN